MAYSRVSGPSLQNYSARSPRIASSTAESRKSRPPVSTEAAAFRSVPRSSHSEVPIPRFPRSSEILEAPRVVRQKLGEIFGLPDVDSASKYPRCAQKGCRKVGSASKWIDCLMRAKA